MSVHLVPAACQGARVSDRSRLLGACFTCTFSAADYDPTLRLLNEYISHTPFVLLFCMPFVFLGAALSCKGYTATLATALALREFSCTPATL